MKAAASWSHCLSNQKISKRTRSTKSIYSECVLQRKLRAPCDGHVDVLMQNCGGVQPSTASAGAPHAADRARAYRGHPAGRRGRRGRGLVREPLFPMLTP